MEMCLIFYFIKGTVLENVLFCRYSISLDVYLSFSMSSLCAHPKFGIDTSFSLLFHNVDVAFLH